MQRTRSRPAERAETSATCRLTLRIADKHYVVRGFPAPAFGARARGLQLRSVETGKVYHLAETAFGPTCDCPDQTFRHEGVDGTGCKHVRALVACGILAGAPTPGPQPSAPGVTRVRDEFDS